MREKEIEFNKGVQMPPREETVKSGGDSPLAKEYFTNGRMDVPLLVRNAKILLAAGDIQLAKNIFRALVENGEALGLAYSGLGSCYELEGRVELAVKAYREAIIYEPTYGSLYALADLFIKKEEYPNAVGTLLRAQNMSRLSAEQSYEIHKQIGNCYMHLGQLNNAEAHYRKAYDINPTSHSLHVNIGSLAIKKGDLSTALLHFKEAIRINSLNAGAHTGAGLAYLGLGNKEAAHDAFVQAVRTDNKEVTALFHLVKCSYELKKFDVICELLQKYIQSNAVNANILYSYAGILYHRGMLKEAQEECDKLISLKPEHEGARKLKELILKKK